MTYYATHYKPPKSLENFEQEFKTGVRNMRDKMKVLDRSASARYTKIGLFAWGMLGIILTVLFSTDLASASTNIVGGRPSTDQDQATRYTVGILVRDADGLATCSGSILDASHILTAAHCAAGLEKALIVFRKDMNSLTFRDPFTTREVTGREISPDYAMSMLYGGDHHDIAILKFQGGLPAGYEPAKMLPTAIASQVLVPGAKVLIAGYGATDALAKSDAGLLKQLVTKIDKVYNSGMSIKLGTSGHGACHGDSGGPAFAILNGQLYLWGVTSRSAQMTDGCSGRAIYSRIR